MKVKLMTLGLAIIAFATLAQMNLANASFAQNLPAPPMCVKSFNPYKTPTSVLRSCGERIEPLRNVTALPGGGKAYWYGDYTQLVPPAHFNVLMASDKQLREYGLPTRKQLGSRWLRLMRHARSFVQPTRYMVENPGVYMGPSGTTSKAGPGDIFNTDTPNWAGFDVNDHTYQEVTVTWTEPHFVDGGCSSSEFGQWAGIGGIKADYLGQEGTAFNVSGWAQHQAWIETLNNDSSPPVAVNLVANAGDSFYASVLWNSSGSYFDYYMDDVTTGQAWSGHSRVVTANLQTAEVMSERPQTGTNPDGSPRYSQLSDFQNVAVTQATGYWGSGSSGFYSDSHNSNTMYDRQNPPNLLATPGTLSSGSKFSTGWVACT